MDKFKIVLFELVLSFNKKQRSSENLKQKSEINSKQSVIFYFIAFWEQIVTLFYAAVTPQILA